MSSPLLDLLRCPRTHARLERDGGGLITPEGTRYDLTPSGIPLIAVDFCSPEARRQQAHYDHIYEDYLTCRTLPQTEAYNEYLDEVFFQAVKGACLDTVVELCCGSGEALHLLRDRIGAGIGVDISVNMLEAGRRSLPDDRFLFVQGDATRVPLADASADTVFMLGGVHHVPQRAELFSQIFRILRPGGRFYWREPVSDFFLWQWLRAIVYRLSPVLDSETERPLLYRETVPPLQAAGFKLGLWRTCGFLGFCLFMNAEVLKINSLFRFIPGIRSIVRGVARLDDAFLGLPGCGSLGLQVVGMAERPTS